jgi:hypothetical protein
MGRILEKETACDFLIFARLCSKTAFVGLADIKKKLNQFGQLVNMILIFLVLVRTLFLNRLFFADWLMAFNIYISSFCIVYKV